MTACVLVVPPGSVLVKFAGQKVKISTVLEFVIKGSIDIDEKKRAYREKCKAYYRKRKEEAQIGKARLLAARQAAP